MKNEDCFLIEESWHNLLLDYFNEYDSLKTQNKIRKKTDFFKYIPEIGTEFINKFSCVINNIKENRRMKLISYDIFDSIFEGDDINDMNIIKYYSGNNKIIIEYKENNDNKAILLINPFNENNLESKAFIISIRQEEKINFFHNILSLENNLENVKKFIFNKNIISFGNYIAILKLFIHIYYYEKTLLQNPKNIFDENKDYYLINPEWLNSLKDFYDCNSYYKNFNKIRTSSNTKINYNNLNKFINGLITFRNNINFYDNELYEKIQNIEEIKCKPNKYKKLLYFYNCYIINSEIMTMIKSIFFDKTKNIFKKRKIIFENEKLYLIYSTKITIGNLNEKLLFIPSYIFTYNSPEILESEKETLLSLHIKRYINSLFCELNNYGIQELKNEENMELGQLLILSNNNNPSSKKYKLISSKSATKNFKNCIKNNKTNHNTSRNVINLSHNNTANSSQFEVEFNKEQSKNNSFSVEETLNELKEKKIENNFLMKENIKMKQNYEKKEKEYKNEIMDLKQTIENNNKKINELDFENKNIKKNLNSFKKHYKIQKQKNVEKEKDLEKQQKIIEEIVSSENTLRNENNILKQKIKELESENRIKKQEKIIEYNSKIEEKEKEIEKKVKEFLDKESNYQNDIINYKNENKSLIKENEILKREKENKEKEIKQLINNNNKFINEINSLGKENYKLKKREKIIMEKEKEINNKINYLEDKEKYLENESNEINKIKLERKKGNEENIKLKEENNEILKQNNYLINKNKEIELEIHKKK